MTTTYLMDAYGLQPLERLLVRDQVAAAVRNLLLSGALPPGAPAREIDIARDLGVSRNPVREALVQLQNEGLLVSEGPQRGLRVLVPDRTFLRELYSLRGVLEGHAAGLAAANRTEEHVIEMRTIVRAMRTAYETRDISEMARLDMQFHACVVDAAGSRVLAETWSRCKNLFWFATRFAAEQMYEVPGLDRAHAKLLTPLEAGDASKAEDSARHHIDHFFQLFDKRHGDDIDARAQVAVTA